MGGDEKNWLLVKMKDGFADRNADITASRPESVLTGQTVEDRQGKDRN